MFVFISLFLLTCIKEIGWFDVSKASEISTRIASDSAVMQEGMGEKIGNYIHSILLFNVKLV
jgi:ATP-binding cassette, subfamily B (MDR/TAP), member 1